jgi:hypothetical protein
MTQVAGDWIWRDCKGNAYGVWPIRKDKVVMSQWAHRLLNLGSPEAATAWPVAMAAQPAKQEEAEGTCSCLVWKTSQLSGALGKKGQAEQEHMGDLSPSDWGNPFFMASQNLHVPQFGMSTGLCATWGLFSLCRRGHHACHCDTLAALISAGTRPPDLRVYY